MLMPDICILSNGFHSLCNICWEFEGSTTVNGKRTKELLITPKKNTVLFSVIIGTYRNLHIDGVEKMTVISWELKS